MIFDGRRARRWLLEPNADTAPSSVGVLGWLILLNGIRIAIRGSSGLPSLGMWLSMVFGGCTAVIGWTIITGRPVGLASGYLAWSVHITAGFFGILESDPVEDDVELLLGIVAATTLWMAGVWILYGNSDFFLDHSG